MNWHLLNRHRWVGPLVALVALYVVFAAVQPDTFPTVGNLKTMVRQTSVVGLGALGMTLIIVLGGIDLSVGSMVAFVTVVIAWLLQAGCPPLLAAGARSGVDAVSSGRVGHDPAGRRHGNPARVHQARALHLRDWVE